MRNTAPTVSKYNGSKTSKWVIEGLRVNGKRVRRFFPTKALAESHLLETQVRLENEGVSALTMPEFLRVEAVKCAETLKPYGKTLTDAVSHYVAHLAAVQRSCTVEELIAKLKAAKTTDGLSERYIEDLSVRLGRFARDFGSRKVAEITSQEINDWLRGLNVAGQTRNNYRVVLGTMFGFAVENDFARENPIDRTSRAKVTRGAPGIFTPEQLRKLLKNADPAFLPYLAIGAFAGIRPAEIARLDWSQIDFGRGLIHLTAKGTKTSARRLVTIQPVLAACLKPIAKDAGPVLVGVESKLRATSLKAAEMSDWPHDVLRHSFASYHLAHFRNVSETATQLGHQNAKMVYQHYREIVMPDAAAEWWRVLPNSA